MMNRFNSLSLVLLALETDDSQPEVVELKGVARSRPVATRRAMATCNTSGRRVFSPNVSVADVPAKVLVLIDTLFHTLLLHVES